jgi:hypothetical protein
MNDRPDDTGNVTDEDRPAAELDDVDDRDELRQRHYGLLQELRVILPGTQVLVAFLFTVPFNNRFTELDETGKDLYALALGAGALAIVALMAPTVFHRVGHRRSRSARLVWGIRMVRLGLAALALSLVAALVLVSRVVFGGTAAAVVAGAASAVVVLLWLILPLQAHSTRH